MNEIVYCDQSDIIDVIHALEQPDNNKHHTLLGFDGYVDSLYHVVKTRAASNRPEYFSAIAEYGARISAASGKSADIDLHLIRRGLGGNAPLMAAAMACQDQKVDLIGSLGVPTLHPCFQELPALVTSYSYADPNQTIALEFNDGKIMMGDVSSSSQISWQQLVESVGEEKIRDLVLRADLIGILNVSAYSGMKSILSGILNMLRKVDNPLKLCFFDLSDPTSLPKEELLAILQKIAEIGDLSRSVLGLNENEAIIVLNQVYPETAEVTDWSTDVISGLCYKLREHLRLHELCVHTPSYAIGADSSGTCYVNGFHIANPKLSTGGGDNFNAGLCSALQQGMSLRQSLLVASAASSYFVSTGKSASNIQLARHIRYNMNVDTDKVNEKEKSK